jgi:hypothetical protein
MKIVAASDGNPLSQRCCAALAESGGKFPEMHFDEREKSSLEKLHACYRPEFSAAAFLQFSVSDIPILQTTTISKMRVEPTGFEPVTSSMPLRRSTN